MLKSKKLKFIFYLNIFQLFLQLLIFGRFQRSGPDGLEAWGVAIAASLINFIMAGINRASGILYVEFIDAFQVDRMKASLPFTIRSVARNLLGNSLRMSF